MTYNTIAAIARSTDFCQRLIACAAEQNKTTPFETWVETHRWKLAATPGWASAWESAVAANKANIGSDETVITDAMILAAVQPMT